MGERCRAVVRKSRDRGRFGWRMYRTRQPEERCAVPRLMPERSFLGAGTKHEVLSRHVPFKPAVGESHPMAGNGGDGHRRRFCWLSAHIQAQLGVLAVSVEQSALDRMGPARSRLRSYISTNLSCRHEHPRGPQESASRTCTGYKGWPRPRDVTRSGRCLPLIKVAMAWIRELGSTGLARWT